MATSRAWASHTHVSDQYGPFHTKVIAATAGEAPHVLDRLLYHQSGLAIEEHAVDTGGASDHVFGLMPFFGYRFAPRLRDLPDRKLHLPPGTKLDPLLAPLTDAKTPIDGAHIAAHWDELLRLAASIRSGTVTAAVILWNTRYLETAAADLGFDPDAMRHVAPLGWEHLSLTGAYSWDVDEQPAPGELRPLRARASLLLAA